MWWVRRVNENWIYHHSVSAVILEEEHQIMYIPISDNDYQYFSVPCNNETAQCSVIFLNKVVQTTIEKKLSIYIVQCWMCWTTFLTNCEAFFAKIRHVSEAHQPPTSKTVITEENIRQLRHWVTWDDTTKRIRRIRESYHWQNITIIVIDMLAN